MIAAYALEMFTRLFPFVAPLKTRRSALRSFLGGTGEKHLVSNGGSEVDWGGRQQQPATSIARIYLLAIPSVTQLS